MKAQDEKLREHVSGITCYKGNEHDGRNPTAWWMLGISEPANSKKLNQFKKTTRCFERLGICQNTLAVVTLQSVKHVPQSRKQREECGSWSTWGYVC